MRSALKHVARRHYYVRDMVDRSAGANALVPKHLAQNRPVVLCGGINVITGPGKPDFFACRNFQVYSPREPAQPNDAFSSYRASLRALLFDPSAP